MRDTPSSYKYPIEKIPDIKLLVLYVAEQARSVCKKDKISRTWLSDFIMENIATNYFMVQCVIGELNEDGYLFASISEGGNEMLSITRSGTESIGYFYTRLPLSVRETVDIGLIESLTEKEKRDAVSAMYVKYNEEVHMASLRLFDREIPQLHLDVTMPDKESAIMLSKAMETHSAILYRKVMEACSEILEMKKDEMNEE